MARSARTNPIPPFRFLQSGYNHCHSRAPHCQPILKLHHRKRHVSSMLRNKPPSGDFVLYGVTCLPHHGGFDGKARQPHRSFHTRDGVLLSCRLSAAGHGASASAACDHRPMGLIGVLRHTRPPLNLHLCQRPMQRRVGNLDCAGERNVHVQHDEDRAGDEEG